MSKEAPPKECICDPYDSETWGICHPWCRTDAVEVHLVAAKNLTADDARLIHDACEKLFDAASAPKSTT